MSGKDIFFIFVLINFFITKNIYASELNVVNYSPIVEVQGRQFIGSGILFLQKGQLKVLTSSHIVLGDKLNPVQIRLPELSSSNFNSLVLPSLSLEGHLEFDDPLADFCIIGINEKNANTTAYNTMKYWASLSFSFESPRPKYAWINFSEDGLMGLGGSENDISKVVYTPVITPYQVSFGPDTHLSGILKNEIRVITFARPGMSGSLIIKKGMPIGIVSKVVMDGTPMAYGISFLEIAEQMQRFREREKTLKARWVKDENSSQTSLEVKKILDNKEVVIRSALNASNEVLAIGGDIGNGGDSLKRNKTNQGTHYWKFLVNQVVGFININARAIVSLVNPFFKKTSQTLEVFSAQKNWQNVSLIKIKDQGINENSLYKAASIPLLLSQSQGPYHLILKESINLDNERQKELKNLSPKYVRFALKINPEFLCFPWKNSGNAWTWDNTMAILKKDSTSLRSRYEEAFNSSLGLKTDTSISESLQDSHYSSTNDGRVSVSYFLFGLNDPLKFLDVETSFGNINNQAQECIDEFNAYSKASTLKPSLVKEDFGYQNMSEFNLKIFSDHLDSLTLMEKPHSGTIKEKKLLRKSAKDSTTILYEREAKESEFKVLLIFDRDNLLKLERIYLDTPKMLFEFIYVPLNESHPR